MVSELTIKRLTPLFNGFSELHIEAPGFKTALPGHYVLLAEKYPYYLFNQQDETISLIVKEHPDLDFNRRTLAVSSLQGTPLAPPLKEDFNLILTEAGGLNACLFYLKRYKHQFDGLVLIGAEQFPFKPCPSRLIIPGMPNDVIAALPLFEDWRIAHRLASPDSPGCFQGTVNELSTLWLSQTKIAKPLKTLYIAAPSTPKS